MQMCWVLQFSVQERLLPLAGTIQEATTVLDIELLQHRDCAEAIPSSCIAQTGLPSALFLFYLK